MSVDKLALAQRIAALGDEERSAFVQRMAQKNMDFAALPIARGRGGPDFPASHGQRSLWFLWKLDPASSAYHMPFGLRLTGVLDGAALRESLDELARRHESLRTCYAAGGEGRELVRQLVQDAAPVALAEVDCSAAPDPLAEARRHTQGVVDAPFDLERAPLLRAALYRLGTDDHVLVVVIHHIASDGWSMQTIVREFGQLYAARVRGTAAALPPLPIRYGDYASWQRDLLASGEAQRQLAYWRARLGEDQPVLALPADHPRRPRGDYTKATRPIELSGVDVPALRTLAAQRGLSLFALLLAALQALLHRETGQDDIRVGVPNANRHRAETEGLVGFFVNTQVIRARIADDMRLSDLLDAAGTALSEAQAHQDLPFEVLVDALAPARSLGQTPLFQVMHNHQQGGRQALDAMPGLRVSVWSTGPQRAQVELALETAQDERGAVSAAFSYAEELFDAETIDGFGARYVRLLQAMALDSQALLRDVDLVGARARAELLSRGSREIPASQARVPPVPLMLSRQAQATPHAIALVAGDLELSYGELDAAVDALATRILAALGGRRAAVVGLALPRSATMVIAALAVMRAGSAYVPLDPAYPADRLQYMIADCGADLLIGDAPTLAALAPPHGLPCLDPQAPDGQAAPMAVHAEPDAQDLAYIIYTSGSTGRPKGVMVPHGALSRFISSVTHTPGIGRDDVLLAVTSLSFDIAALELYAPLAVGARVILADSEQARDGAALQALVRRHRVSVLQSTPAAWRMLLDAGEARLDLKGLCGGEALLPELAERLRARGVRLWNMYGPTETTIWSLLAPVGAGAPLLDQAIEGTRFYVLDPRLAMAPAGPAGELYLGGEGVARGYLNRPGLTAERFVPDPFGPPGARMYRSGDRVRWRADGLEYLGRNDQQVKIRGYRIEPGEVEDQLLRAQGVREAVVRVVAGPAGAMLVGYASAQDGCVLDESGLKAALARKLPAHMVPAAILVLDALPQTPNGKIDRNALPDLREAQAAGYEAPREGAEAALAALWESAIGVDGVGRHDNFFALGGDSILSLQVASRARAAGIDLQARDLFEHQTIAELAAAVGRLHAPDETETTSPAAFALLDEAARAAVRAHAPDAQDAYPAAPTQAGMLFHAVYDEQPGGLYVTQLVAPVAGLDLARFEAAWRDAHASHAILRTAFLNAPGGALQWVDGAAPLPFRAGEAADREAALAQAREDRLAGFDPARAPLYRVTALRQADSGEHVVIWTCHHLLLDGWSRAMLLAEILRRYQGLSVPPRPPYRNHLAWLAARPPAQDRQYWQALLAGLDEPTYLHDALAPSDAPRPAELGAMGRSLSPGTWSALQARARAARVTANTAVQGAWLMLLHRYTRKDVVAAGMTLSGRPADQPGADTALGLFINTVPLVSRYDPALRLDDWLRGLQQQGAAAQEHGHAPLAEIQRWAGEEARAGLFDTLLVFDNYPVDDALRGGQAAGLQFGDVVHDDRTHYPLTLAFVPGQALRIECGYDREHYAAAAVASLLDQLVGLLEAFARGDDLPLAAFGTRAAAPSAPAGDNEDEAVGLLVPDLFERVAAARPDAPALRWRDARFSYGELNLRANRVAHALIRRGVGPETCVGVALARGDDLLVALLAVFKAGGAYLPLDPDYPASRREHMMRDSGIRLLLSSDDADAAPDGAGISVVDVRALEAESAQAHNPARVLHNDNLAYLIYTSGSTGLPKGVEVTHGPLAMHVQATATLYDMHEGSRELHSLSFAFDGAHERWMTAFAAGAELVLAEHGLQSPADTARELRDHAIGNAGFPPQYLHQVALWLEDHPPAPPLDLVSFGGEAMAKDSLALVRRVLRPRCLINGYGPTETVVTPLVWKAVGDEDCGGAYAPIGRPVGRRSAHLRDRDLNAVSADGIGELYIGGYGIARGYRARPGLTAERFVPDPDGAPGARCYRSGDLAAWLPDGQVQYLGRADHQLKLRGFRIEPGEIESQLLGLPGLSRAVVVLQAAGGQGSARLVAYVCGRQGQPAPDPEGLRQRLRRTLPDYMVPAVIVVLDALPLTPSGKVDTKALPQAPLRQRPFEPPAGAAEVALAPLWASVLGVSRVGRNDDFFELGGNSILALQIVSRAQAAGWAITPRRLFEHPTLAACAAAATPTQRIAGPRALPRPPGARYPLSPAQQRLWFLWQLDRSGNAYNMPLGLRLKGALDIAALRRSLTDLVARHESLRTRFDTAADGTPGQIVDAESPLALAEADFSRHADAVGMAQERARELAAQPFDLALGPVLRAGLFRIAQDEHLLMVVIHHIATDGWSMQVAVREFAALYAAHVRSEDPALSPLPLQYVDYAAWRRGDEAEAQAQTQLAYWRERLGPVHPPLALPADGSRGAGERHAEAHQPIDLPADLGKAVGQLARRCGCSRYTVLLAAFMALLQRLTGQEEIRVGAPVANRNHPEIEGVVGFFVNTLVVSVRYAPALTGAQWVARVGEALSQAQQHQDVPFEQLVEALGAGGNLAHTPLFQVMHNHLAGGNPLPSALPGLTLAPCAVTGQQAKFELTLNSLEAPDGALQASFAYSSGLFSAARMARMAGQYAQLLRALAEGAHDALGNLWLAPAGPARQAWRQWGAGAQSPDAFEPAHAQVANMARARPEAIAVVAGASELSYGELDDRSARLAGWLAGQGVAAGHRVGIALERGVDLAVAVLAVLKAGAAYVPLDPAYPAERLQYMIEDSGMRVLLTHAAVQAALPRVAGVGLHLMDGGNQDGPVRAPVAVHPGSAAYVIYTSGSTGRPKGVEMGHGVAAQLLAWQRHSLPRTLCTLQFAALGFDVSFQEIFGAWSSGATLVMPREDDRRDFSRLLDLLRRNAVQRVYMPFAMLQTLAEALWAGRHALPALAEIITAGEQLIMTPALCQWLRMQPGTTLVNHYGPTETHVVSAYEATGAAPGSMPPIGTPAWGAQLYVADGALQPSASGVAGELFIGGNVLAQGYVGRPGLTAERFVPAPFGAPGGRMYRSGDLARWREDGQLEYLGRADTQVKIRGFRVEPGEIESRLMALPGVGEAVVVAQAAAGGDRLVGYVARASGNEAPLDAATLRTALARDLPDYMVPSTLLVLDRLPRTPNGKLDRRGLPAAAEADRVHTPPRPGLETTLAQIWGEVLGAPMVGGEDDFFALGGHSLLSVQLVARVNLELQADIQVRSLFEHPTLQAFAAHVESAGKQGAEDGALAGLDSFMDTLESIR